MNFSESLNTQRITLMRHFRTLAAAALSSALLLGACSGGSTSSSSASGVTEINVGASPTPHAKILQYISDNLLKDSGISLKITEITDYSTPNRGLDQGDLDANYFQTVPYLEKQAQEFGFKFTPGQGVHLEPLALYSNKLKNLSELPDGAKIGVVSDVTNQERALRLLASKGLVKVPASGDVNVNTVEKLKNFTFIEVDGPQLVRSLADVDAAVINGNFAQEAGLKPADSLAIESPENNPSVNILVWKSDLSGAKLDAVKKLEEVLHSPEVKQYIEKTWSDGSVIPAF